MPTLLKNEPRDWSPDDVILDIANDGWRNLMGDDEDDNAIAIMKDGHFETYILTTKDLR